MIDVRVTAEAMDALYQRYTQPEYLSPDPLELVVNYPHVRDREIVGLVVAALSYGRVGQILRSARRVLEGLGKRPGELLAGSTPGELRRRFEPFRHRVATGAQVADMLLGARRVVWLFGSLEACFAGGAGEDDETLAPALARFVDLLDPRCRCGHLIPRPRKGSACKRLWMYLRWMIRSDAIDPGGWNPAWRSRLIVPLDTHMHRMGQMLGLTSRRSSDAKTAIEITRSLRRFDPSDPVKYDFALTRLGIHPGVDPAAEFARLCEQRR
jgi:uncharacterized protein (TIGR02757 family)